MRRNLILFIVAAACFLPSVAQSPLNEAEIYRKLITRQNVEGYKEGTKWDNDDIYFNTVEFDGVPAGYYKGGGCFGFMMDMMEYASDYEYSIRIIEGTYDNLPPIHVGDGVRVNGGGHSVVVLERNGSVVTVAEANYNRTVHWGRIIDLSDPDNGFTYIATFWPESSIATGLRDMDTDAALRDIRIFNTAGTLMKSISQTDLPIQTLLNELPQGFYIVKEGTKSYKVLNK
jgi:hypothetical protein